MVIDDSILRSGIRVARLLGLGGMAPEADAGSGPGDRLAPDSGTAESWMDLLGDGSIRRLHPDLEQVNSAFATSSNTRATRPRPEETFIDLYATLATAPAIGRSLVNHQTHMALPTGGGKTQERAHCRQEASCPFGTRGMD